MKYEVRVNDEVIVTRTERKPAEQDVRLLKDICHKTARIVEVNQEDKT
jgi:hypothetical protein